MKNYFETRFSFDYDRRKVWSAICEYLQIFINKNDTVLDLGAGYCDFINNIRAKNKIAVDLNEKSLDFCAKDVRFVLSSSSNLEFLLNNSVDVIFSSNLFEHLDDFQLESTIKEIYRVLKKDGRLILIQPNFRFAYREYFDDYTHKKIFSDVSLSDFLNANEFNKIVVLPKFLPFSFKSWLPKSYWLTKLYLLLPIKPMAKQMLLVFEK